MDWDFFRFFKKEKKSSGALKAVLITFGVIAAVSAAVVVLIQVFKKYFTITFECNDCDACDEKCFDDDDDVEPICSAEDDESAPAETPETDE